MRHWVDTLAVAPIRIPTLRSDEPALLPYTEMIDWAVDGCAEGLVTKLDLTLHRSYAVVKFKTLIRGKI